MFYYDCIGVTHRKIFKGIDILYFMKEKLSEVNYVSPLERGYSSYVDHIEAFNRKIQDEISHEIPCYFKDFEGDIAITTTGSDARLEKGPVSLIEIILFGNNYEEIKNAHSRLTEYMSGNGRVNLFDKYVETKEVSKDPISYYYGGLLNRGDVKLTSPNRMLDSRLLYSTDNILAPTRKKFIDEIKSTQGKSVFKDVKEKYREHRKITLTGKQEYKGKSVMHFNPNEGVSFYDPNNDIWSIKQGPLRLVQYALVRDTIKRIRDGTLGENVFMLPKNTVKKLHALEVNGRTSVPHNQIEEISDTYKYMLHLYHASQFEYRCKGTKEIEFDSKEYNERATDLQKICSENLIN